MRGLPSGLSTLTRTRSPTPNAGWGLEDTLLYSSDYPHWDGDWPHTVAAVQEREDISETTKRKMMHDNVLAFYKLQDTAAGSEPATQAAAAR